MNTIIAATDYSELAENAVEYAAAVAKLKNERLILLNDISVAVHAENARLPSDRFEELLVANEVRLGQRALALSHAYGIDVVPKATNSFVENELETLVAEYHAYMVVLGMEPQSRVQEWWGNTTTSVIKKFPLDVLAVPAKARFEGLKKVLFACDALHGVSEALLTRVKNVALLVTAEVEVLVISPGAAPATPSNEAVYSLQRIGEGLEGIPYHIENVNAESIVEGIRMEVIRSNADLLVMAPQKHGFWDSLIHRSKTRMMAAGLDIPLLSVPA